MSIFNERNDLLQQIQRAEFCLRRCGEGDPEALAASAGVCESLRNTLESAGWRTADDEENQ